MPEQRSMAEFYNMVCCTAGTTLTFRLNWGGGAQRVAFSDEFSIFVGDLSPSVSDEQLMATFKSRYASVSGAKVVMDPRTCRSRCYGFVRFSKFEEQQSALNEMSGAQCSGRPMRISEATPRKCAPEHQAAVPTISRQNGTQTIAEHPGSEDNSTVFVGGLKASVTENDLYNLFRTKGTV